MAVLARASAATTTAALRLVALPPDVPTNAGKTRGPSRAKREHVQLFWRSPAGRVSWRAMRSARGTWAVVALAWMAGGVARANTASDADGGDARAAAAATRGAVPAGAPRSGDTGTAGGVVHVVAPGDSLWAIARRYGCDPREILRARGAAGSRILPGDRVRVPACRGSVSASRAPAPAARSTSTRGTPFGAAGPARRRAAAAGSVVHRVAAGDTLYAIARRYDTTVEAIRSDNALAGSLIRPGQALVVPLGDRAPIPPALGQSVGRPHAGRLRNAARLVAGPGYVIRRPERAYAAAHVVAHVRRAVAAVRRRHPRAHALAIGDLSARRGGRISGHRSHQSGRDVDLGLYYVRKPRRYPNEFVPASPRTLDLAATWALISALAATADDDGGVERMFLDYRLQRALYRWALAHGVPRDEVRRLFQYPDGRGAPRGLIRHVPAHADHLHVRFKCPAADRGCR